MKKYKTILKSAWIMTIILLLCLLGSLFVQEKSPSTEELEKNAGISADGEAGDTIEAGENTGNADDTETAGRITEESAPGAGSEAIEEASENTDAASDTTLVFAGDIYLSEYVQAAYDRSGIEGVLSDGMLSALRGADLAIANNEFPYSTRGTQAPDKQFTFRVDPSYVSVLQDAGIDIVTLANNHVLDYGTEALEDTFQTLDEAGIAYAGAGASLSRAAELITREINGMTIGFLAASRVFPVASWNVENAQPGVFSTYDPTKLLEAIEGAAEKCDFLCVYVHWGIERNTSPEEYQVLMGHAFLDAGADAVIGAHPHVLQGVEWYKGKPIFYSLGNFIFYQSIERTAIAKAVISPDQNVSWQLLPAYASDACTLLTTDETACAAFYEYMEGLSEGIHFSQDGIITAYGQVE